MNRKTILIVENDSVIREMLGVFITSIHFTPLYLLPFKELEFNLDWITGYNSKLHPLGCFLSTHPREREVVNFNPELVQGVISDFSLWNEKTSLRLLATLRFNLPQAKILLLSGHLTQMTYADDISLLKQAGIFYLPKPADRSLILNAVGNQDELPPCDPAVLQKIFRAQLLAEVL